MSKAGHKKDSPSSNTEPLPTASFPGKFAGTGSQIGPYKLLRTLGEGGFGIVFLAEQREPVKRQVALKIIKPGMDTKQVIARFEAERQALALLDHPNIAHVFDAGTTQQGRPYFVMEYVKGVPITEYCDRDRLSIKDRLGLFIQVCDAIQHAHQKGIIHRDIKPSNVLVEIEGKKPMPMIIDFGVAKAVAQPLTEHTFFTEAGQMIGTPAYMSPEQAEMTAQDVDTRTDIYSLGVLLYELLVGVLPYDSATFQKVGYAEIQKTVREIEPLKPSTRLGHLREQLELVAKKRRAEARVLIRQLHGDLDCITMKALEKSRTRRYPTASEFAADILRHMQGEPVLAHLPTISYRLRKFLRKHSALAIGFSCVVTALTLGLLIAVHQWQNAQWHRIEAKRHEREARVQQIETQKLLASSQIKQGIQLLKDDNSLGLLHLLDARLSAEGFPDLCQDIEMLWAGWERSYSGLLVQVVGHNAPVNDFAFHPNGDIFATASDDGSVCLWNLATGTPQGAVLDHTNSVQTVVFSPDGKLVATGTIGGTAFLWDVASGKKHTKTLEHGQGKIKIMAFSPNGKIVATAPGLFISASEGDPNARLWSTVTGEPHGSPLSHGDNVNAIAFSPDGTLIATGSSDGSVQIWNTEDGSYSGTPLKGVSRVYALDFSPDGTLLAVGLEDATVRLWNVKSKSVYGEPLQHERWIISLAFSPNGRMLASSTMGGNVWLWDLGLKPPTSQRLRHQTRVYRVAFSPDSVLLVPFPLTEFCRFQVL